jgi:hypothetical protein
MSNLRQPVTTGLTLPTNTGLGQTAEQAVHQQWDTLEEQREKRASEGFSPMDQPDFGCPQVTEEVLTTADSKAYTATYAQQLAWFNYASQTLSRCVSELLQVDNEMDILEARMRKGFRERMKVGGKEAKMTAEEMRDEILLEPRHAYLMLRKQQLSQYKVELGAYTEGIERGLKVISRQVEIRKMEIEQSRVNIPNRGYGGGIRTQGT